MASQTDRIHNALYALLESGDFHPISFDRNTGLRTTNEAETEAPSSIKIREEVSVFDQARNNRRQPRLQERVGWDWNARVAWDHQVSLEEFEENFANNVPLLPRTAEFDQQVTLLIDRITYTHPPEHASSSGTSAEIIFSAVLSRK